MKNYKIYYLLMLLVVVASSCVSTRDQTRQALYFTGLTDSLLNASPVVIDPVFQAGDILSIEVTTPNEASMRMFNRARTEAGETSSAPSGYLVSGEGSITFPYLGAVQVAGLTKKALTDTLEGRLKAFVEPVIVSVRLQNYRITVLGEVNKPGTFSIPSERVTVLDALGLAGDLTVYGKRNNIRVIRTEDGRRMSSTLDLNKGDIFGSPYFYLRQNDVVYVEMNERKIPNTDQSNIRNISLALGIISALGVVISTINVLK